MAEKRLVLAIFLTVSFFGNGPLSVFAQQASGVAKVNAFAANKNPKKTSGANLHSKYIMAVPKSDATATEEEKGSISTSVNAEKAGSKGEDANTRLNRPANEAELTRLGRPNHLVPATAPDFNQHPAAKSSLASPNKAPQQAPLRDKFPTVGQLESLMFGHASPAIPVDNRLEKLELAIFQKGSPELDTEARIRKLKEVIVGSADLPAEKDSAVSSSLAVPFSPVPPSPYANPGYKPGEPYATDSAGESSGDTKDNLASQGPYFQNFDHADLKQELSLADLDKFALVVINDMRTQQGLEPLAWDDNAYKVCQSQVSDLANRNLVSHLNSQGENPDVRYAKTGGTDALDEGLILFTSAQRLKANRELVVKILELMAGRQDDRESFLSHHATHFALSLNWTSDRTRLVCCTEIVTRHGQMKPIPLEANVGDKIEVKGSIEEPYRFNKITLSWEGPITPMPDDGEESNEAMPYFPPLDYEAHAAKSERDWDKGVRILQIAGITAAIAGGFFIPPVALAAPLIAASSMGAGSRPKAVSEIPVKGGVKTSGNEFSHKVSLNNDSKEGIYYLTVWATTGQDQEMVPISRRAIIAHKTNSSVNSSVDEKSEKPEKPGKKNKSKKHDQKFENEPEAQVQ